MIPPAHGGRLVDRLAGSAARERRESERRDLPKVRPAVDQLYDAEKIGIGSYSPLEGFMGSAELESVLKTGRLPNDLPWTIPILFPIPTGPDAGAVRGLSAGDEVAIVDASDRPLALLAIEERFRTDRAAIARATYGTEDPKHPNVADLLAAGDEAWAGKVTLLRRLDPPGGRPEPSPGETRAEFHRRGWKTVAAYQCRNPPHTAHEYIQRLTLEREDVDGLFIHPVVGRLKKGDYRPDVILESYEALVRHYYPPSRVMMSPLGITMRYGGPKAALFLAIVRKNYGCGAYIVGRDQAGVGQVLRPVRLPPDLRRVRHRHPAAPIRRVVLLPPLRVDGEREDVLPPRQLPRGDEPDPDPRGAREGGKPPRRDPETGGRGDPGPSRGRPDSVGGTTMARGPPGFCVWMTGLPSAGKTTIGKALVERLSEQGWYAELLDGDEIRKGLSADLGFDRASREAHAARVTYVAKVLARNGAIPIVALISPYRSSRARARSEIGRFVEVYINTPLAVCEERDVKGLYKRARAGEIKEMTGVSDPYKPPEHPEIVVDAVRMTPAESAALVLRELERQGWLSSNSASTAARSGGRAAR